MKYFFWILFFLFSCTDPPDREPEYFTTIFEASNGTQSAPYEEVVSFYEELALQYSNISFQTMGETDSGLPLHLVVFNEEAEFNFEKIHPKKTVVLINNGIHPGEPDGVDACMLLFRDLATGSLKAPVNTVIAAIPLYNIGGALNRNSTSRVNQNGPMAYGFRGNARNYDLNRDFIKSDTRNARAFAEIFHLTWPDVFLDTHVSNGADYQYTLTHLITQSNKLGGALGGYLKNSFTAQLETRLKDAGQEIIPYVNVYGRAPQPEGYAQFLDHARYSTGYAALWNTLGLMLENHMLKPYKQRVKCTYEFIRELVYLVDDESNKIKKLRERAFEQQGRAKFYPLNWQLDSSRHRKLIFKGYKADTVVSEVTGLPRLRYLRENKISDTIPFFNTYRAKDSVKIPEAYIIPQAWRHLKLMLDANQVFYETLKQDTVITVESYKIASYETFNSPFEGHYPHYNTQINKSQRKISFKKGDFWIPLNQRARRYILEIFEPAASDSFFNWNFFDTILQQKEGFSPYVFEDNASNMLKKDSLLNKEFEETRKTQVKLQKSSYDQLNWIYKKSPHYEKSHLQYPVFRVINAR